MKRLLIISFSCLCGLIMIWGGSQSVVAAKEADMWVGYPQDSHDWSYRYVFDSPKMKSGWVEYLHKGKWLKCGHLEDIKWDKSTMKCKGPIMFIASNDPDKLTPIGGFSYYFDILKTKENSVLMGMTCDAFDSRKINILFKKESHNNPVE